jgi:hypothetical protein
MPLHEISLRKTFCALAAIIAVGALWGAPSLADQRHDGLPNRRPLRLRTPSLPRRTCVNERQCYAVVAKAFLSSKTAQKALANTRP